LVIEGFLERKTTMTDRRAININLTRLGTERAEILVNHAKKLDYQLREKLGNKETETLVEVLNQVIRRVR
jgi:DNA-binding MarR family transcriptional regulator